MTTTPMTVRWRIPRWRLGRRVGLGFLLGIAIWVSGCSLGEKRTYLVRQYILEYPSPTVEGLVQTKDLIKIERFSVAQAFNTTAMLYQDSPYVLNSDPYNRWKVNPGEMVQDCVVRDLRKANLFRAVYSYHEIVGTRYVLQGQVEDFLEMDDQEGAKAILGMNVTLLDLAKEAAERVLFQRSYHSEDPLREKTAVGFAQAMSRAMESVSRQLMLDLREATQ